MVSSTDPHDRLWAFLILPVQKKNCLTTQNIQLQFQSVKSNVKRQKNMTLLIKINLLQVLR